MILHLQVTSVCPECGDTLRVRTRRADGVAFISCSGYPDCRFAADLLEQDLLRTIEEARREAMELRIKLRAASKTSTTESARRIFLELIAWAHPDKHPSGVLNANEVTARLNAVRSKLA